MTSYSILITSALIVLIALYMYYRERQKRIKLEKRIQWMSSNPIRIEKKSVPITTFKVQMEFPMDSMPMERIIERMKMDMARDVMNKVPFNISEVRGSNYNPNFVRWELTSRIALIPNEND